MGTLSFHVDAELEKRLRLAAKRRKVPLSRFLKKSMESALASDQAKGRELRGIVSGRGRLQPGEKALPPWNEKDPRLR